MSNHDEIIRLAKEHLEKIKFGIPKLGRIKKKEVNCSVCKRKMTVRDFEHPPFYCYKCDDELEGVLQ